jgi:hypothetical protein
MNTEQSAQGELAGEIEIFGHYLSQRYFVQSWDSINIDVEECGSE